MSNDNYYVGPPETSPAPAAPATKQAPQVTGAAQQAPAAAAHNYFVGAPVNPEKAQRLAELAASPAPQPPPNNRSSFLARCFPCICASRAREQ